MNQVAGNRLPHGARSESLALESSNAAYGSKEPTRMKNHGESVQRISNTPEKPSALRKLIAIGALSTIALAGCAAEQAPEKPQKTTEAPAEEPQETEAPEKTYEEMVNELKIEAGLSPEDYAQELLVERWPAWELAGKEQLWEEVEATWDQFEVGENETDEAAIARVNEEIESLAARIAAEQQGMFTDALFIPGWQNTALPKRAEWAQYHNELTLDTWRRTKQSIEYDGAEGEEWQEGEVIERVELVEEDVETGTRKMIVTGHETNNGETAAYDSVNAENNGAPWSYTITTQVIDGIEYLTDWSNTEQPAE